MLRGLVSPAKAPAPEHIEAVTAERDFFRDKYAEQIEEVAQLRGRLKESQRAIAKLRREILTAEEDKAGPVPTPAPTKARGGSTATSVTCPTDDDEPAATAAADTSAASATPAAGDGAASANAVAETAAQHDESHADGPEEDACSTDDEEEEEEAASGSEDDEAEDIRANAARMLLWANYQTSKRATPTASPAGGSVAGSRCDDPAEAIVYALPARLDYADDDSSLGSSSRHPPPRAAGASASPRAGHGRVGALFHNLRDLIDPPAECDAGGASDAASTDGDSD